VKPLDLKDSLTELIIFFLYSVSGAILVSVITTSEPPVLAAR